MIRLRPGTGDMSSHISPTIELTTRRRYTREEKASIVAESLRENSVSAVARRYRVAPAQLFRWKKEYGPEAAKEATAPGDLATTFVPAVLAPDARGGKVPRPRCARRSEETNGAAEIAFPNGCVLRVPDDIKEAALVRLVRALRA